MMFIDIHAHLTDKRYGGDVSQILADAKENNLCAIVDSGYSISTSKQALLNAKNNERIFCTLGIHPESAKEFSFDACKELENMLIFPKCIGLGEIGLDYHYEGFDKAKQMESFLAQLELANRLSLPVVIHSRDCSKDMVDFLTCNKNLLRNGFLMHCYSESIEQSKRYLDLGGYFSFGGVLTFKNSKRDEVLKAIPLDRILAETDCPYLAPMPFRGKTNYPHYVVYVYEKMCEVFGCEMEFLAEKIKLNAKTLFKKLVL